MRRRLESISFRGAEVCWHVAWSIVALSLREYRYGRKMSIPLHERIGLWRHGFLSESSVVYHGFTKHDRDLYITDWERFFYTHGLNAPFDYILHDKFATWSFLGNFTDKVFPLKAVISDGRFWPIDGSRPEAAATGLAHLSGPHVLKPNTGSGGAEVHLYVHNGGHTLDGEPVTEQALEKRLRGEVYLVCPFVEQDDYAKTIFPETTNTIRILTMYDIDKGDAFVAAAVHRFGACASGGLVDNWGRGGVCAAVDLDTGILSQAYTFPSKGTLAVHTSHPDTGAAIAGTGVPGWVRLRDEIVALARRLPFLPYIGWDIVRTNDSYVILEGNNRTDINLFQVHHPLLEKPEVHAFYASRGVLRRPRRAVATVARSDSAELDV